jgi:hypothetical protein
MAQSRITDLDHFLIDAANADLVPLLEVYLKGVLGPALEANLRRGTLTEKRCPFSDWTRLSTVKRVF